MISMLSCLLSNAVHALHREKIKLIDIVNWIYHVSNN